MVGLLIEMLGLALIGGFLFLLWPPALLALAGVLLIVGVEVRGRR